jgi:hypothetical protein
MRLWIMSDRPLDILAVVVRDRADGPISQTEPLQGWGLYAAEGEG